MRARLLSTLDVPKQPATLPSFTRAVAAALSGNGPAVLPLPVGATAASRSRLVSACDPRQPLELDDVALVVPTSGSTGEPKAALLSAAALRASATATHRRLGGAGQWLLALPLTHIAGLMVLIRSLDAGLMPAAMDLGPRFDAAGFVAASALLSGPRRYTALVPTQLYRLLYDAESGGHAEAPVSREDVLDALRSYDAVLVGAARASASLLAAAGEAGVRVVTTYGMTETCGGCVYDGIPLDGVDVEVSDDGRLTIGGSIVFSGYRLQPDLTRRSLVHGRLITSDFGRLDADGSVEVLGRTDDVVIIGGTNVSIGAVERAILTHPDVAEVVVVATPDPEWGNALAALVRPRSPQDAGADGTDEQAWLAEVFDSAGPGLPASARPRRAMVAVSVPMTESGKVDRSAVRSLFGVQPAELDPPPLPRGDPGETG